MAENWIDVRGSPMSGVVSVSSGSVIELEVDNVVKKAYTASADGKFHVNGYFIYTVDENVLTDNQKLALVNNLGGKLQLIASSGGPPG